MGMQSMGSAPARNQIRAAGASSDAKPGIVPAPSGKQSFTASDVKSGNGHTSGSSVKGFSTPGVLPGFVK